MSNITIENVTLLSRASDFSYTSIIILTVTVLLTYAWYGPSVTDRPYPGFPLIGKEGVKTTQEAKLKWIKSAKSLIYETLAKVSL